MASDGRFCQTDAQRQIEPGRILQRKAPRTTNLLVAMRNRSTIHRSRYQTLQSVYRTVRAQHIDAPPDSKSCVQAHEKLCRGELSVSPRVSTFLSVVSRYQVTIAGCLTLPVTILALYIEQEKRTQMRTYSRVCMRRRRVYGLFLIM